MKHLVFILNLSCLLSLIGLNSCASRHSGLPAQTPAQARRELHQRVHSHEPLAILFVGNSYSFGLPKALAKEAEQHGRKLRTGHSTFSGWTLAKHAAYEGTLRKIREGHWDIVVLQELSLTPSQPQWRRNLQMLPPLQKLAGEARRSGAIPILYQTWGRRDGNPLIPRDDFFAMNNRVRTGYRDAAASMGNLIIVPAGDGWEKEAAAGHKNELFMPDGSHPSSFGNQITARIFYLTLFGS